MLRDVLHGSPMMVSTDRLGLLKLGREVFKKNKLLLKEVEEVQKTVTDDKAA